jgi:hypothetical protein
MISEKLVSRHPLNNGLSLEFWDLSRPTAGDRWQVVLEARIRVPIIAAHLTPDLRPILEEVVKTLGREITFSQKEARNFVAVTEVTDIVKEIEDRFLSALSPYLGHRSFPGRFIRKTYTEYQEKQRWRHS